MRRNSSTVVVLAGQVPGEVLAAATRSLNVTLYRPEAPTAQEGAAKNGTGPEDGDGDSLAAAAAALQRAGRSTSPYALVPADPLAVVAARWQEMWDLSKQPGPAAFELAAAQALAAWRGGQFELPDYYLVLAAVAEQADPRADFYLGPLRAVRPHRVSVAAGSEPAAQAAALLGELGTLRHGPWWPSLEEIVRSARGFYPGALAESASSGQATLLS
jgi:hypothetical protein